MTEREIFCLLLLADGASVKEICVELDRSPGTVKHVFKAIRLKLNARNNTHAVALAYHHSILKIPNAGV